ncbi:MAG: ribonuclease P protein component [Holosporales bacterium]|nr:ribonuclease P protein component [Holosporales bacterium]
MGRHLGPGLSVLRRHASFEKAWRQGVCFRSPVLLLQAYRGWEGTGPSEEIFWGVTASRRVGSAVHRNRVKRRLRSALREVLTGAGLPGYVYVVVAKREIKGYPWNQLLQRLREGIVYVHRGLL